MYSAAAAERAIQRIGRDAYAILRTKAMLGIVRQRQALDSIVAPLSQLVEEMQALPEDASVEQRARLAFEVSSTGQETHWSAILRLGTSVETLCGLLLAFETDREGGARDIAELLVRHDLDLFLVLREKKRKKLSYWEALAGRPAREDLLEAGLTPAESQRLLSEHRSWCTSAMKQFQRISAYYTPARHQVYGKYKHGYTLIDPGVSPLSLDLGTRDAAVVNEALQNSFVVMHQDRTGRRVVHVVRSGGVEIEQTMEEARQVLDLAQKLAVSWLFELEHPLHRVITFDKIPKAIASKWVGDGLDETYDLTGALDEYPEDPRATRDPRTPPETAPARG